MHKRISGFFVILLFLIGAPYGYAAPGQIFEIQVGAYSDSENAEMMRKNIEQQGYTVFTREIHDQNGKRIRFEWARKNADATRIFKLQLDYMLNPYMGYVSPADVKGLKL